jgi:hypothetical protein
MEIIDVKPGQLWLDNDKRNRAPRFVRVTSIREITDPFKHYKYEVATCEAWYDEPGSKSRTVQIRVDRFKPIATGYRLVEDVAS